MTGTPRRVAFHWSGGKDSALALLELRRDDAVHVDRLVTAVHRGTGASTVHEIPVELLRAQAESIGLPLQTLTVPGPGLDGYVEAVTEASLDMRAEGVEAVAFGDLRTSGVLELKRRQFDPVGLEVIEPLWGLTSQECIERFLASGIQAVTVVVDAAALGTAALGSLVDRAFVSSLPGGVDPCGEQGEFHSFAFAGGPFASPVDFTLSAPRQISQEIGTTSGPRTYTYWLATPRPVRAHLAGGRAPTAPRAHG